MSPGRGGYRNIGNNLKNSSIAGMSVGKDAILEKKEFLDFSSVPAHDNERNCTKTDQCNECTKAG